MNTGKMISRTTALLLGALMVAGCSGNTQNSSSTSASVTSQTETTARQQSGKELLDDLMAQSSEDSRAKEAWMNLFAQTASSLQYNYQSESDGDYYQYTTDAGTNFVTDHFLYNTSRKNTVISQKDAFYNADLSVYDDSLNNFEFGFGSLARQSNDPYTTAISIQEVSENKLQGTVRSISQESSDQQSFAEANLADALFNNGYVRNVDPVNNASLYSFDLSQDGDKYILKLAIKDLDAFRQQADKDTLTIDQKSEKPVLKLGQIESETYTIRFDQDGRLISLENEMLHVLNSRDENTFVNIGNKTELKAVQEDDLSMEAMNKYFASIADGSIKEGSAFTLENWE